MKQLLKLGLLVALLALFLAQIVLVTIPNIENYPLLTGDEGWAMSASYKLANTGVFGSDLFRDFYNGDTVYFFSLPVHHFLQALSFHLLGASIASARLVSVLGASIVLVCLMLLAYRWFGLLPALVAALLLLWWQPLDGQGPSGLLFLEAARSARYDMTSLAFAILALLLCEISPSGPTRILAMLAGLCAGFSALSQFVGIFVAPAIGVSVLLSPKPRRLLWAGLGFALPVSAYGLYIALHPGQFYWQTLATKPSRISFLDHAFYLHNLANEPLRYAFGFNDLWALLLFFIALLQALITASPIRRQATVLAVWLSACVIGMTFADATKSPLYGLCILPGLCLLGALFTHVLWQSIGPLRWVTRPALAVYLVALALTLIPLSAPRIRDEMIAATRVSHYNEEISVVRSQIPHNADLVLSERIWWGLRDYSARTISEPLQLSTPATWEHAASAAGNYYILDDLAFVYVGATTPPMQAAFARWLDQCTELVAGAHTEYGYIHTRKVTCGAVATLHAR